MPIFLAIISMFALPCLQWIFDAEETADVSYSTGTCHVIKHLMNHSLYDLTAALESSPNISEAMTLLQNLELPREKRRECNKVFVACLQSWKGPDKTFVWMKRNIAHETCKTILEDHQNSGTWREIQIDKVEDWLKESQQKFQNFSFKKSCSSCRPIQGCSCCKKYCGVCKKTAGHVQPEMRHVRIQLVPWSLSLRPHSRDIPRSHQRYDPSGNNLISHTVQSLLRVWNIFIDHCVDSRGIDFPAPFAKRDRNGSKTADQHTRIQGLAKIAGKSSKRMQDVVSKDAHRSVLSCHSSNQHLRSRSSKGREDRASEANKRRMPPT